MIVYPDEGLYIAGPECFYSNGYELWWAQRKLAEYHGIPVVLPTSTPLKCNSLDLRDNAKEIFDDLVEQVKKTTAIIADLEFFRGSEPDGGTVFEMGWIWAKGGTVYGYTRDGRSMAEKKQLASIKDAVLVDHNDRSLAYPDLPFCPDIMGSTKIIEGTFSDILKVYIMDLEQKRKGFHPQARIIPNIDRKAKRIFISSPRRYFQGYDAYKEKICKVLKAKGFEAIFPHDEIQGFPRPDSTDPYRLAQFEFESNMALLRSCSIIISDLNNFQGMEPCNDVSFECGVAFGNGLRCIAFMSDTRIMREKIPHWGEDRNNLDWCGNVVENFNLPINLMFGVSFEIFEGDIFSVIQEVL